MVPTDAPRPSLAPAATREPSRADSAPRNAIRMNVAYAVGSFAAAASAPHTALAGSFATAAPHKVIKGFAIGRTVFEEVARQWFCGVMDDDAAVNGMAERLAALVSAWRHARAQAAA